MNNKVTIEENRDYQYQLYKAKNSLWYFNESISRGFNGYNAVKFKNEEGTYVWLENVSIANEFYTGNLSENDSPELVRASRSYLYEITTLYYFVKRCLL